MATAPAPAARQNDYPTSDGRPMAETDLHRELMFALIKMLQGWFAGDPMVYVSGNLLVYYVPGNRLRHLSPDVFVVKGVAKHPRLNYLIWEEGKSLDVVIELTSSSTREEDLRDKMWLYRDELKVPEYFLFDPQGDYLSPRLRGYRLHASQYIPILPVAGRLPSEVLGLHLEQHGSELRLYNPATDRWLPTPDEALAAAEEGREQAEQSQHQAEAARQEAELARQSEAAARQAEAAARRQVEAEVERLRRELEELRRHQGGQP